MRIRGIVDRPRPASAAPAPEGSSPVLVKPAAFVSVEGFSLLVGEGEPVPPSGREIEGVVQVLWRKEKRPLHILRSWELAI